MSLTADEICKIIKTCNQASVSSIKISGEIIEVCFTKPIVEAPLHAPKPNRAVTVDEVTMHPMNLEDKQTDPGIADARDHIAELVISDPVTFEEMLGRGELVDGDQEAFDR